ncbi:MAG: FAD:protein FMN transferase [Hydrogenophaga sp.]|uniref:FAD:protein FMN transferase n=1 Tax=Hydrogenophaga sp. TaxID=1904254 RepID=UPI000DB12E99|nr:FAD:protein FMN transferase [Hydrogenophaga sp.]MDO9147719.1 FAD:protein FMN transferase [Hydrogenophaga sp.]MDO9603269.1 FAD:protein FMN transferase [Hydrogenophaga sp.]PZO21021.1 MAG: thiamine biosynthesis protein ApbE [Burkholderiales bacterium]
MPKMSSESAVACKRTTLNGPTMGTRWSAIVDADHTLDVTALRQDLAAEVEQVDAQMSPWKPDSDLMRLNRASVGDWVNLPDEIMEVLACALDVHRLSAGAFDPCVGALVDAWGFGAVRDVPDSEAIRTARQTTPRHADGCLELDKPAGRVRKRESLQLDLCGIAKGYAVDRMVSVLQKHGVRHALAALDGELCALGSQASGVPWSVALERPEAGLRAVHGVIELDGVAVATSGDYRRFLQVGDARLAHTMDARRCAPVNNAVASVTVLARSCMHADAWATALLVAGPDEGLTMAQRMGLDVLFLLRRAEGLIEVGLGRFSK